MNLAEQTSLTQSLLDQPHDQRALVAVYEALGKDGKAYATLLVAAAERTDQDAAASHWLTEAARVKLQLRDERGGVKLLEAALERDPLNMRAAEHLVELYRNHQEDEELADVIRARAAALHDRYVREPTELPRAAVAFEKLSGVYEAIGDAASAIAALRTALELERARGRHTTPSPPPDVWPESSFRALAMEPSKSSPNAAPAPERWSVGPESDSRDTMRSPVPENPPGSFRTSGALEPSFKPPPREPLPGDPLLAMIEALHALRRFDDVVEGAALVLRTALQAIPSAVGFVHVSDVASHDFVLVAANGDHDTDAIGTRATESDPVLKHAVEKMQAVAIDARTGAWFTGVRFHAVCPSRQVLCAPVHYDGRQLGAIELIDPTRRDAFTDADRHAMTYVGERFGEFLADRSLAF